VTRATIASPTWRTERRDAVRVPERSLALLRDLVHAHTGMFYDEARLTFLEDRLTGRAIERGFDSLLDYYYLLKYDSGAAEEWMHAIDALAVQETYFWREHDQLRALTDGILPLLVARRPGPIRIWSLPCSTGEEPLSIAIALTEAGWFSRAEIHLHASDASEAALTRARAGRYGGRSFRQLPETLRRRYFEPLDGSTDWTVRPDLHARVRSWTRVNAIRNDETAPLSGSDVIFCRNMFIYFDSATVARVVNAFADAMPSPGFLCVAAAESLLRLTTRFELREIAGAYVYVKP
jgi:chemotaxis protein methyltransferase CheR